VIPNGTREAGSRVHIKVVVVLKRNCLQWEPTSIQLILASRLDVRSVPYIPHEECRPGAHLLSLGREPVDPGFSQFFPATPK